MYMKKFISVLLSIALVLTLAPLCLAASTGRYIVTKDFTSVYSSPSIAGEKIAEIQKNTIIEITQIRNDTFGKAYIAKDGVTGWVQLAALSLITPHQESSDITAIKIKTLPHKLSYTDGLEELDLSGLTVVSIDKNQKESYITSYCVYAPEMKVPGEKTITVTYSPDSVNTYSASFTVTVSRLPVTGLSLTIKPKLSYMENQTLDLSSLIVTCNFENPAQNRSYTFSQIKSNPDFTITACHGETHGSVLQQGSHTVRITYKYPDIFTEFTVDVTPRTLLSLSVKKLPDNLTVYSNTSLPALDGLVLEAVYDNGETEEIYHGSCQAVCDPSAFIIGPGNQVKVYFGGLYVTIDFRYSKASPEKIALEYPQGFTLTFLKGEAIDLSEIKVRLVYTDGTGEYIDGFEMSAPDPTVEGSQHITVTYREFSEVFIIVISPYFSKGDVDGNGKIQANDARQTLRAAVGLVTLSGMTFFAGDADRNGSITAADARLVLRAAVGLENLYITL